MGAIATIVAVAVDRSDLNIDCGAEVYIEAKISFSN